MSLPRNILRQGARGAGAVALCTLLLDGGAAWAADTSTMDGWGGDGVDDPVALPSGLEVLFHDIVTTAEGASGLTYRFRFLAPWLAGEVDPRAVTADMGYLCEAYALPRVANIGPQPQQIVISLSDRPVEFGQISPDVVQFFEAYRPDGTTCVWEFF